MKKQIFSKEVLEIRKKYPLPVYVFSALVILSTIFMIAFYWQDSAKVAEIGLYNNIGAILFVLSAVLCFVNYKLLLKKDSKTFFQRKSNFFLIFGIILLIVPLIDRFEIHHAIIDFFIASKNAVTAQLHALIPALVGIIAVFSFVKFWKLIKGYKAMVYFLITAALLGILNLIIDVLEVNVYLEESIGLMMAVFVLNAFVYVLLMICLRKQIL